MPAMMRIRPTVVVLLSAALAIAIAILSQTPVVLK